MKAIDIHIHGGYGINFDNAEANQINEFARNAKNDNLVAFCPTLTGASIEKLNERLHIIKEAKNSQKKDEALIIGVNLEGTFLNREKSGVQNPKNFLEPTVENFKNITKGALDVVKIVVLAPENRNCSEFINYLKANDIKVHFGHTLTREIEGADCICHLFNAMEGMSHKYKTLALSALMSDEIYTEVIADGVHIIDDMLKLIFKVKNPDKVILISDALPIAKYKGESVEFCGKKILKNGLDEQGTLGGSCKLLPEIMKSLIERKILSKELVQKFGYENPKDYLKLIV